MTVSSQTDSLLCFPLKESKALLSAYEQNLKCDSIINAYDEDITNYERYINTYESEVNNLNEIIKVDNTQIDNLNEVIDLTDKQVKKSKTQRNISGIIAIIVIILAIL